MQSPSQRNSFGAVASASYIIDIWGQLRDTARAAQFVAEASDYDREAVRLTVQAAVVNAYLQYAAALDQLRIANENTRNAERILGVVQERLSAGTGSALDVAQQETLVANQRAAIPVLRLLAANARTTLAILVGRPPQGFEIGSAAITAIAAPRISPGVPATLLTRRPDIRRSEALLASAEADVSAARKALLPTIALTGQGGFQSAALSTLMRPESALWSVAAGLTQPIFEGGRLRAQIDLSDAQRLELLESYRKTIITALTDVENALNAIRESERREAALRIAIDKANTAFRLSEERLRQGTIDLVTLLSTQQSLFQAQDALIQARLTRLQAAASLFQALGGDWLERGGAPISTETGDRRRDDAGDRGAGSRARAHGNIGMKISRIFLFMAAVASGFGGSWYFFHADSPAQRQSEQRRGRRFVAPDEAVPVLSSASSGATCRSSATASATFRPMCRSSYARRLTGGC